MGPWKYCFQWNEMCCKREWYASFSTLTNTTQQGHGEVFPSDIINNTNSAIMQKHFIYKLQKSKYYSLTYSFCNFLKQTAKARLLHTRLFWSKKFLQDFTNPTKYHFRTSRLSHKLIIGLVQTTEHRFPPSSASLQQRWKLFQDKSRCEEVFLWPHCLKGGSWVWQLVSRLSFSVLLAMENWLSLWMPPFVTLLLQGTYFNSDSCSFIVCLTKKTFDFFFEWKFRFCNVLFNYIFPVLVKY